MRGVAIGVPIGDDIWRADVCASLARSGAELLLCPSASPYWRDRPGERLAVVRARVGQTRRPLLFLNAVGGQDELVFDGASFGIGGEGELAFQAKAFTTDLVITNWERGEAGRLCLDGPVSAAISLEESTWRAIVLGLRDYLDKNGVFAVCCWGFPAASTAQWWRRWPWMRWASRTSIA